MKIIIDRASRSEKEYFRFKDLLLKTLSELKEVLKRNIKLEVIGLFHNIRDCFS